MQAGMTGYFVKNIGANRGKPRIWLEKLEVSSAGLKAGDRFDVHVKGGTIVLKANADGSRVVSGKDDKKGGANPVIDINSSELLALFDGMAAIRVVQREGEIYLLPLATEIRKKERLSRLKQKVLAGLPLETGSLSHGGGLLANAVHEGLQQAGLATNKRMANEIRTELLNHASQGPDWSSSTLPIGAPMQELAFDASAMRHVPRLDVMEAGLPCSGASVAGRAKRGTAVPEDHSLVGHLVVAALVILAKANPAVIMFENVKPYASSASASILRNQLRDLGYVTHETVLRGKDFNAMEDRERWCMVAVTEGMHFDWEMLQMPARKDMVLSDFMDEIAEDHPMWSEMAGLKAKQERDIEAGKGFRMQVFGPDSTRIATVTKGYAKVRSTDPKIQHPSNPNLLRQLTVSEHARLKQYPPEIVEGLSAVIAHEMLGQGVQRDPFLAASKLLGESIQAFAHDARTESMADLIQAIADEVKDTASMVVSEIRAPLARVVYEGPVSINDLGMVVQDIGNGIGILHRASVLENVRLGEVLRVQYPRTTAAPRVEHLSIPAPVQTPSCQQAIAEMTSAHQASLFDQPHQAHTPTASPKHAGPRF
ncbi:hypothetical protein SSTU70S_05547 [Stutzerimonas stutzeri]